jgi:GNAT superfamily N-acetyltransferase
MTTIESSTFVRRRPILRWARISPSGATLDVRPAETDTDWMAARVLVGGLVEYIAEQAGVKVDDIQEGAEAEFDHLDTFYGEPGGIFLLGRVHGTYAGSSGLHWFSEGVIELKRVFVDPSARGHGLAPLMLRAAIDTARILGAQSMRLETHEVFMAKALAMYRANGFREIEPYSPLGETVEGVVSMELPLVV